MFGGFFKFGRGAGIVYPPISDDLQVWLKGGSTPDELQKLDSWAKPDQENWTMSQSNCITLNGTDEVGSILSATWNNLATVEVSFRCKLNSTQSENYVGVVSKSGASNGWSVDRGASNTSTQLVIKTSAGQQNKAFPIDIFDDIEHSVSIVIGESTWSVSVDGIESSGAYIQGDGLINTLPVYLGRTFSTRFTEGLIWDFTLNGIHFRIAEGNDSEFSWDDTGSHYITWDGVLADMWAGRQDSYHGNAVEGYGRLQEFVKYNSDYTNSKWDKYGSPVITQEDGYQNIRQTVTSNAIIQQHDIPVSATEDIVIRMELRRVGESGNNKLNIKTRDSSFGNAQIDPVYVPSSNFMPVSITRPSGQTDLKLLLETDYAVPDEIEVKNISMNYSVGIGVYANGDSIIKQSSEVGYVSPQGSYPTRFAFDNNLESVNNAVPGSTLAGVYSRVQVDVVTYPSIPIALITGGSNDIDNAVSTPVASLLSTMASILNELETVTTSIVIVSIPMRGSFTPEREVWAVEYNTGLQALANDRSHTYFEIRDILSPSEVQVPEYYTLDTTHQNNLGSQAVAVSLINLVTIPANTPVLYPITTTKDYTFDGTEMLPFLNDEKGGTWNNCETAYAPEEHPLGTVDGTEEILLPFDVPADGAMTYNGTTTATLDIANNKITMTAGTIRDIEITGTPVSTDLEMTDNLEMTVRNDRQS